MYLNKRIHVCVTGKQTARRSGGKFSATHMAPPQQPMTSRADAVIPPADQLPSRLPTPCRCGPPVTLGAIVWVVKGREGKKKKKPRTVRQKGSFFGDAGPILMYIERKAMFNLFNSNNFPSVGWEYCIEANHNPCCLQRPLRNVLG